MKASELRGILDTLDHYYFDMPSLVRTREQEAWTHITLLTSQVSDLDGRDGNLSEIASVFSEWLVKYLRFVISFIDACVRYDKAII